MSDRLLSLKSPPIVEAVLDIDCDMPPALALDKLETLARDALRDHYPKFLKQFIHALQFEAAADRAPYSGAPVFAGGREAACASAGARLFFQSIGTIYELGRLFSGDRTDMALVCRLRFASSNSAYPIAVYQSHPAADDGRTAQFGWVPEVRSTTSGSRQTAVGGISHQSFGSGTGYGQSGKHHPYGATAGK